MGTPNLKNQMSHSKVRLLRVRKRMEDISQDNSHPPPERSKDYKQKIVYSREKMDLWKGLKE